jgi:hypothetical protein
MSLDLSFDLGASYAATAAKDLILEEIGQIDQGIRLEHGVQARRDRLVFALTAIEFAEGLGIDPTDQAATKRFFGVLEGYLNEERDNIDRRLGNQPNAHTRQDLEAEREAVDKLLAAIPNAQQLVQQGQGAIKVAGAIAVAIGIIASEEELDESEDDSGRLSNVPKRVTSHDAGVQLGREYARESLNLKETDFVNPFEVRGQFGQGFDDVMEDNEGNIWIVEHKGGAAELSPGQMERKWVEGNIQRILREAEWNPWGMRLQDALEAGKLRGVGSILPRDPMERQLKLISGLTSNGTSSECTARLDRFSCRTCGIEQCRESHCQAAPNDYRRARKARPNTAQQSGKRLPLDCMVFVRSRAPHNPSLCGILESCTRLFESLSPSWKGTCISCLQV